MKEKVLYIELPEGANFRELRQIGDGVLGIVYETGQVANEAEKTKKAKKRKRTVEIPKPEPLFGGSEVYQKNGSPYWYCRIKGGRDEFMHLYTQDLTVEDVFYDFTGKRRCYFSYLYENLRDNFLEALENKPKSGYRWIPVCDPSLDEEGELQFVKDKKILTYISNIEWEEKMKVYSPENGSRISSKDTFFLLLLRWLKDGVATQEELAYTSNESPVYWNDEKLKNFGGLYKFVGSTGKLVRDSNKATDGFIIGWKYDRDNYNPNKFAKNISEVDRITFDGGNFSGKYIVGFLELEK